MWYLSVMVAYVLAVCWRRTAIPNGDVSYACTMCCLTVLVKLEPGYGFMLESLYSTGHRLWAVLLCWFDFCILPISPFYQFSTTWFFLCPSHIFFLLSCFYYFPLLFLPFSAIILFLRTVCFSQTRLVEETSGILCSHLPFCLSYIVVY